MHHVQNNSKHIFRGMLWILNNFLVVFGTILDKEIDTNVRLNLKNNQKFRKKDGKNYKDQIVPSFFLLAILIPLVYSFNNTPFFDIILAYLAIAFYLYLGATPYF